MTTFISVNVPGLAVSNSAMMLTPSTTPTAGWAAAWEAPTARIAAAAAAQLIERLRLAMTQL